jgi:transposase
MGQNFLPCDRDQELLLPPSLREWLPEDHFAWFVIDSVAELDLAAFYADYRLDGHGRAAFDPAMMVALLVYAYARGERSARLVERRCVEDVAYRVIAAGSAPDHATIARFRVRHEDALAGLFTEVLGLCREAGLVRAGTIALDSTRLHAAASGQANMTYEQIVRAILEEAAAVDAAEDELYGDARGDELPPELANPRTRRARLREAKRRLDAELAAERERVERHNRRCREHAEARAEGRPKKGRPPVEKPLPDEPSGRVNVTDPDSRSVVTHRGFIQGYNAQAVVTEDQIVIAADVVIGSPDGGLLEPMIDQTDRELAAVGAGEPPRVALADAGYWSGPQIERLTERGVELLVPPDGHASERAGPSRRGQASERMRRKLETDEGRRLYARRQHMIEPVFGDTKSNRGIDRFLRRGQPACRSEWRLITATGNLLKLWRHGLAPATG